MKDRTGRVIAQVPVDVGTFLLNEKRLAVREIEARCRGEHWVTLPKGAWVPPQREAQGRAVGALATVRAERRRLGAGGVCQLLDLADADRSTGEAIPREVPEEAAAGRVCIEAGDVLVARLRPNLGNVALAPEVGGPLVGSPEWVVLAGVQYPGWLLHALRSPTFREALPVTGGQTRPRTSADAVLGTRLRWPGEAVAAEVDRVTRRLRAERAALRDRLLALQAAVDAFVAGELGEAELAAAVAEVERGRRPEEDG